MSNIKHIISLATELIEKEPYGEQLYDLLTSPDILETHGNPQSFTASFALKRSILRLDITINNNIETFGLPYLIDSLNNIPAASKVAFFSMRNSIWSGGCYLFEGKIVGCEFVKRGSEQSRPGLWIGDRKIS